MCTAGMPRSRSVALEGRLVGCLYSIFNVVLYNCTVLYTTYAGREGALSSSIVLHSCHPDIYKQMWWRAICSYCVSRLDRHVTYYSSHMLYIQYVDTRLSLPSLKYTVVAWLLTCLHLSTSGDPTLTLHAAMPHNTLLAPTCTFSNLKLSM
jgi:hypothetical protein